MIIRHATYDDWQTIATIEKECFPSAEAASAASFKERLNTYPEGCLVAIVDDVIIGFINGGLTSALVAEDAFYGNMGLHELDGPHLVVFGIDVLPDFRRKGYARMLMNAFIDFGKSEGKTAILLTCKSHLVDFYESFGYINSGLSESSHGGAEWYDMKLTLL